MAHGVDHIDSTQGRLPDEYAPHLEGQTRFQRFTSPFGDQVTVQVTAPGDIDWDVDEQDWARDY